MTKKMTWKEHALDYIKTTKKCPGELPPTGSLEELFTHEQFMQMVTAVGPHKWDSCCFVEEVLGLPTTETMKRLDVDPQRVLKDVAELKSAVIDADKASRLVELRKRLHSYIDQIEFKPTGHLFVPSSLIRLESYINSFFS